MMPSKIPSLIHSEGSGNSKAHTHLWTANRSLSLAVSARNRWRHVLLRALLYLVDDLWEDSKE